MELTSKTRNLVPHSEFTALPYLYNNTKTSSPHDLTQLDRRSVGPFVVVQPRPHCGVQGYPCHLDQDLTGSDLQITDRLCLAFECSRSDVVRWAFVEDVLLEGRGQRHVGDLHECVVVDPRSLIFIRCHALGIRKR